MDTMKVKLKSYQECKKIDDRKRDAHTGYSGSISYMYVQGGYFGEVVELYCELLTNNQFLYHLSADEEEHCIDIDWFDHGEPNYLF